MTRRSNLFPLLLIAPFLMTLPALGQSAPSVPKERLLQRFTDENGMVVGVLVGAPIESHAGAFESLRFLSPDGRSVLYRVTRTATFDSRGKIDTTIHDDGSRGFTLEVVRYNYVHIGCCAIGGGAMDGLVIEWNHTRGAFELLRTP